MSSDGSRVIVGAIGNDADRTPGNSGRACVWEYSVSPDDWIQLGQGIDGEAACDELGHPVAVSSIGLRVAAGALLNGRNGVHAGHSSRL